MGSLSRKIFSIHHPGHQGLKINKYFFFGNRSFQITTEKLILVNSQRLQN